MSKKLLSFIAGVSGTIAIIGTLVWGYFAQDETGTIRLEGNENYSYILFALAFEH